MVHPSFHHRPANEGTPRAKSNWSVREITPDPVRFDSYPILSNLITWVAEAQTLTTGLALDERVCLRRGQPPKIPLAK